MKITKEQTKQKFKAFGVELKQFALRNYLMLGYLVVSILIELTGIAVTSGKFYMTEPWLFFTFLAFVCIISAFFPGHKSRFVLFVTALSVHFVLDLVFIIVFDSTAGTVFDYAMINLRGDAVTILESIPMNFAFVFVALLLIAVYGVVGYILMKRMPFRGASKHIVAIMAVLLALVVESDALLVFFANVNYNSNDLSYKLYQAETSTYSNKGIVGNFANELARGWWFSEISGGDPEELESFIYRNTTTPSNMYGKATDYNVVTILCESFEWFTFLCDETLYPNGFAKQIKLQLTEAEITAVPDNGAYRAIIKGKAKNNTLYNYRKTENIDGVSVELALYDADGNEVGTMRAGTDNLNKGESFDIQATGMCTGMPVSCKIKSATVRTGLKTEPKLFDTAEEITAILRSFYPNLYRIYDDASTAVLNNSHSLEKTDISENKCIIGNYPLYEYINYSYPDNTIPYSIPNMMKNLFGVESNSFHDGFKSFYNRDKHHTSALGFESFTASEDMNIEDDATGGNAGEVGERNLDSVMFETCKELMFPTDRRFYTHITTITQHGQYAYRENLKPYYDLMDAYGILPEDENDENATALRYYCAAGMDLDNALGIMLDYLDQNDLADNTLIVMYGDHNAYYQGVSNYVKNIYNTSDDNYTSLYRVPVMIKVGNRDLVNDGIDRVINKFTCVVDIQPTILDLLGVTTFSNLTYGVTAFDTDNSSVLYSRAYDRFVTDRLYFNSINHIIYKSPDVTDEYIAEISEKSLTLLNKISHVNRIFASDFFKGDKATEFYENVKRVSEFDA